MGDSISIKKKSLKKIIYIIFGLLLIISLFWLIPDFPKEKSLVMKDNFPNITEPHYAKMPITYRIFDEGDCNPIQITHFRNGLEIVVNLTSGLVNFIEVEENPDLKVTCINREQIEKNLEKWRNENKICKNITIKDNPQTINWYDYIDEATERFFSAKILEEIKNTKLWELCYTPESKSSGLLFEASTLGEGGISNFSGSMILKGEIKLYQEGDGFTTCTFPTKEIHELLHALGFAHVEEPYWDPYYGYVTWEPVRDILFPRLYCEYQKELNEKYVSCLKYIYSNGKIGKCGNNINFLDFRGRCSEGWYPVEGTEYCCPEPNMEIVNGNCI
jgi:hypothetical protein